LIQRIIQCINMSGYSYYYEKLFVSGMSIIISYDEALTKLLLSMALKLLLIGAQCSRHFFL